MKKAANFLWIALLFNASLCFAQPSKDNYFSLTFPKSRFEKYLKASDHPNFDRFIFTFTPTITSGDIEGYALRGFAYNKDGTRINHSLTLLNLITGSQKNLPSKNKGEIHFKKAQLEKLVRCSFKLVPKKFKDGSGKEDDYVSYGIEPLVGSSACFNFPYDTLDPCPPVVCGFGM